MAIVNASAAASVVKVGATKIAEVVVADLFPIPRHLCVPNVSWSLLPYEADLLAMTKAGYLCEVEIKISLADLKRDAVKAKWSMAAFRQKVSRFYYAMPAALWDKPAAKDAVRDGAGVIVVAQERGMLRARTVIEAARTGAVALNQREQFDLARVGSYRYWSPFQKHRLRQFRAEQEMEKKLRAARYEAMLAELKEKAA